MLITNDQYHKNQDTKQLWKGGAAITCSLDEVLLSKIIHIGSLIGFVRVWSVDILYFTIWAQIC